MGSSNNNKHNSGATNSGHHIELVFPVAGHPQPSCSGSSWACPRLILSPQKVGRQYTFFSMFFHVFPCFSQNMLNSLTGYFTTEMGKLHWSGTFAATFPVTNSVLRTSFRSPTCCICATCFAVATSVNFPLHSVACDRLLRSFSFTFGKKTVIFCLKYG